jgi:hypothetical protein
MSLYEDATHDLFGFGGGFGSRYGGGMLPLIHQDHSQLGQEFLLSDSGALSPISFAGSSGPQGSTTSHTTAATPSPTLVTAAGSNLSFDLVWDASVAGAPSGFTSAIINAAHSYASDFTSPVKTVIYIAVGWGEINGTSLSASALGESESAGYLTNYATVAGALGKDGYAFHAANEPTSGQFFVTSAEAKALALVSGTGGGVRSVDGYVGISTLGGTGYSWSFGAGAGAGATSTQFNLQSVASHEISEVMGRIAMEGTAVYYGKKTYTPLDLFNYSSQGVLQLSGAGGYFSTNTGVTHMGNFNQATTYGGDIGDWASYLSPSQSGTLASGSDAFDAFTRPGYGVSVSADDLLEVAALGYRFTPAGSLLA